ncbi:FAD-dependent oxidoreductase [Mucilaginibacter myungsuensis]|uniref:FAD-dependent oxidoreductase n=1 Tax=Mucilaginibacter myungsuensis TaxID=649104 RepID=A0A929KXV5_9SPHI|nr:FAD-dependent oxidoreductase [Mucilaginibacter myungsuensis]MBE9663177.1 FAD-dependent oxidoreductase [Mucilaginibacter myungsuensis]MDN3598812.1 FAD-dependent oxidoreductase [Mucilaginibacter myungsuensis]
MTTHKRSSTGRDGAHDSPWQDQLTGNLAGSSGFSTDTIYDCLIIGAGITGLTAALLLQNAGKKVIIAEAHCLGFGTTGGTSAHINTFADTTYKEAESAFGKEGAQLFADAVNEGAGLLKANISAYQIDCDFETKTGYVYAEDEKQAKQLADIFDGAKAVGVPAYYVDQAPAAVPYQAALEFPDQAQFHPIKYLQALLEEYLEAGGILLANAKIETLITENELHIAEIPQGAIKARQVIYATHIPPGINSYSLRCAPYRSYVLAVKLKGDTYPDALVYDMQEPYHYFRTHVVDGEKLLIAGGNDHKTGHDEPEKAFADLVKYVRDNYDVSSVKYRWSSQYYVPVDGFPYIGQMPEAAKGIYCATGYNGNGMMLGSIAGKILSDLAQGKDNKYADIFSPSRLKPIAGFTAFVQENADVAYHFVADRFGIHETDSLKRLSPGTGQVVEVDGKKIAAYRDDSGKIHALSPVCTHAGCIVNWNGEEKSWDCPCHGARYDIDGKVLTGPATLNLATIDPENNA